MSESVIKTENETPKKKSFIADMQDDTKMAMIEAALPNLQKLIKPFITPAYKQLLEYLGDEEKILMLRGNKTKGAIKFYVFNKKAFDPRKDENGNMVGPFLEHPVMNIEIDKPDQFMETLFKLKELSEK